MTPQLRIVLGVVSLSVAAAPIRGAQTSTTPHELAHGQTVVLGTFPWDLETNQQTGMARFDLFWEQVRPGVQNLVPQASAGLTLIKDLEFEKITRDDLRGRKYSVEAVPNTSLTTGTVLGLRTLEGNFAKLRIVGYRASQDFDFESAKLLDERQRALSRSRPNVPKRHLEILWALFEK